MCESKMILFTVDAVTCWLHAKMVLNSILEKNYYPACPNNSLSPSVSGYYANIFIQ